MLLRTDHLLPTRLSGLILWLDAAKGITIATGVSQWDDQSGAGNHATQGTGANQPTYAAASALLPGHAAVQFDGVAHYLICNALATTASGTDQPLSVLIALGATATAGSYTLVGVGKAASATPFFTAQQTATPGLAWNRRDDANTNLSLVVGAPAANTPYVGALVFTGTTGSVVTQGSTGTLGASLDVGAMTVDQGGIGCLRRTTNSQFFPGEIYEILVFNRAVTNRERKTLERYLGQKYRLMAGLSK
jgi:hypothetical protein